MSPGSANLTIGNNIALAANQEWKVGANYTLTANGVISGSYGIGFGTPMQTYSSFLPTSPTTIFNNLSLASIASVQGVISGGYVGPAGGAFLAGVDLFLHRQRHDGHVPDAGDRRRLHEVR